MNFEGIIIEESLTDNSVLSEVNIVSTKVEPMTVGHQIPWIKTMIGMQILKPFPNIM